MTNPTWDTVLKLFLQYFYSKNSKKDEGILTFESAAQFLQIPGFSPRRVDASIVSSVAFAFYIKITQPPTTPATIFTFICDSVINPSFLYLKYIISHPNKFMV